MSIKRFFPLFGLVLLFILLYNFDFSTWIALIYRIPLPTFLLTLTSSLPVIFISNIQWQYLLKKQDIHVSFLYSMKNIFIGYFYGLITPGGIGAYTRVLYLKNESNETLEKCFLNIGIFNTIDLISLFFISIVGAFVFSNLFPLLFYILLFFCVLWIIFIFFLIRKKTWNWIQNIILRFTILKKYHTWISTSVETLQHSLPAKKDVIITWLISIMGWILRFSIFYLVLGLFSIEVSYVYVVFIIAIANIIAMIPISVYGLGTRETVLISLFSVFNVSSNVIIGVSLYWFFIIWIIPSILGAFISLYEGKKFS